MHLRGWLAFVPAVLALGCSASSDAGETESDDPPRVAIGKADTTGTCVGDGANTCGGKSSGNCWCDAGCAAYGDCCADVGSCGSKWTVNDVSFLFPLPKAGQDSLLLRLDAKGAKGELLPKKLYTSNIPYLWEGFYREEGYNWSRVFALRIDPCAGELERTATTKCRAEIRLSAQPLWGDPSAAEPMTSVIDAAMHLIYEISKDDFAKLLNDLSTLRASPGAEHGNEPLGVHPVILREGLDGPFAKGLKEIILRYAGAKTLTKFTVMDRGRNSTNWRFFQFEKQGTAFVATPVPATDGAIKQGVNELGLSGENNSRDTLVSPVDEAIGYPSALLKSDQVSGLPRAELEAALGRLASFEDPGKTSNLTLDCGSCHTGANARTFFEQLTDVPTPKKFLTFVPPSGQNVERKDETKLDGHVMRAFGWVDGDVAVSQRTINESARVADWLTNGGN